MRLLGDGRRRPREMEEGSSARTEGEGGNAWLSDKRCGSSDGWSSDGLGGEYGGGWWLGRACAAKPGHTRKGGGERELGEVTKWRGQQRRSAEAGRRRLGGCWQTAGLAAPVGGRATGRKREKGESVAQVGGERERDNQFKKRKPTTPHALIQWLTFNLIGKSRIQGTKIILPSN